MLRIVLAQVKGKIIAEKTKFERRSSFVLRHRVALFVVQV
jgi:hypothetical protein